MGRDHRLGGVRPLPVVAAAAALLVLLIFTGPAAGQSNQSVGIPPHPINSSTTAFAVLTSAAPATTTEAPPPDDDVDVMTNTSASISHGFTSNGDGNQSQRLLSVSIVASASLDAPDLPETVTRVSPPLADATGLENTLPSLGTAAAVAGVGALVSFFGGPSDTNDLQLLGVLSGMSCSQVPRVDVVPLEYAVNISDPDEVSAVTNGTLRVSDSEPPPVADRVSKVLSPITFIGFQSWSIDTRALIGSAVIVAGLMVAHRIVVAVGGVLLRLSQQEMAPKWHYPNAGMVSLSLLSQGAIVSAVRLLARPEPHWGERIVGGVVLLWLLTVVVYLGKRRLSPEEIFGRRLMRGRFLLHEAWDGTPEEPPTGKELLTAPVGFWTPSYSCLGYGAAFAALRPKGATFRLDRLPGTSWEIPILTEEAMTRLGTSATRSTREAAVRPVNPKKVRPVVPPEQNDIRWRSAACYVIRPLVFGVVAGLPLDEYELCDAQFIGVATLALGTIVALVVTVPYRWAPANGLFGAVAAVVLIVCVVSLSHFPVVLRDAFPTDRLMLGATALLLAGKVGAAVVLWEERADREMRSLVYHDMLASGNGLQQPLQALLDNTVKLLVPARNQAPAAADNNNGVGSFGSPPPPHHLQQQQQPLLPAATQNPLHRVS